MESVTAPTIPSDTASAKALRIDPSGGIGADHYSHCHSGDNVKGNCLSVVYPRKAVLVNGSMSHAAYSPISWATRSRWYSASPKKASADFARRYQSCMSSSL